MEKKLIINHKDSYSVRYFWNPENTDNYIEVVRHRCPESGEIHTPYLLIYGDGQRIDADDFIRTAFQANKDIGESYWDANVAAMMSINPTDKEIVVILSIAENNFQDGPPSTKEIWTDCLDNSPVDDQLPKGRSLSAVIGSLVKKGLVESYCTAQCDSLTAEGTDSTIRLTDKGLAVYHAM